MAIRPFISFIGVIRRKPWTPALLAAAAAVAGAALWWWRSIEAHISSRSVNILNYDGFALYYPTFRYAFEQLRRGEFPLWNPYQLCGTPFFANGEHIILYRPS